MSSGGDSDSRRDLKRAASTDSDESFISKKSVSFFKIVFEIKIDKISEIDARR